MGLLEGEEEGALVGVVVGDVEVGEAVVGELVVGETVVGAMVVGDKVGLAVGLAVGLIVGEGVGPAVWVIRYPQRGRWLGLRDPTPSKSWRDVVSLVGVSTSDIVLIGAAVGLAPGR